MTSLWRSIRRLQPVGGCSEGPVEAAFPAIAHSLRPGVFGQAWCPLRRAVNVGPYGCPGRWVVQVESLFGMVSVPSG